MNTINKILNDLISHEISKKDAEKLLTDILLNSLFENSIEMNVGYCDEKNGIYHIKRNYNCAGVKGLKKGDKIFIVKV